MKSNCSQVSVIDYHWHLVLKYVLKLSWFFKLSTYVCCNTYSILVLPRPCLKLHQSVRCWISFTSDYRYIFWVGQRKLRKLNFLLLPLENYYCAIHLRYLHLDGTFGPFQYKFQTDTMLLSIQFNTISHLRAFICLQTADVQAQ